ncbi:hypothetical protein CBR_g34049 [Chara braunii]|uniref:Ubiquitin-like protease family profile domain-containing protein n=1 Tax=Chara braunii TaxID=69332 RepID=A0A388LHZ4_CHABU|nr:hypothetical protein CBR_g34049 [Chara braunii]|eukprot:GBG81865.1 hypothetical protein CBR_g34049 [Chara braunii]
MSMSAAQARTTLKEVMQYAEEGIHYDDDGELELLTERVPSYFEVRVNIRASITANGEESLRARMLLARFTEARDLRVNDSADTSAYRLRKVVGWMCTEGMSAEGDVDMTKQQQGGTYTAADFKKMLMTQARKWGMFVEDSNDELKSGGNRSTGMAAEAGKRPKRVDEEHLFPFTWKSRRHAISITKRDVLRLGAKQWLNDNVIDMYLQFIYDEHFPDGDNMTLHVCTSFWHTAVIANQKVYVPKAEWQGWIKSTSPKLRRISNELRTKSVVLIPVNHENHWKLLLLLNVGQFLAVTEDNDGQKRPVVIVIDSFQQSDRQEWKALRTFLWYEYLSEADKAGVLTPDTVDTSWVT